LLRKGESLAVDFFEDSIAAATEQGLPHFLAETLRIAAVSSFAENLGPVGVSHQRV
jgi:hypothetical protein